MNAVDGFEILNRCFIRIYRSFTQYMTEASPYFDIGDEETIRSWIRREADDATTLGQYIARMRGNVQLGQYPQDYGDFHFLSITRMLIDWVPFQERLVRDLEADAKELPPNLVEPHKLLSTIISHEKDLLSELKSLASTVHHGPVSSS